MKKRITMQVALEFDKIIKDVQREVMKKEGKYISVRDITAKIRKEDVERILTHNRTDINIKFDRRFQ